MFNQANRSSILCPSGSDLIGLRGVAVTNLPKKIEFNRPAKFTVIKVLGKGACGETVLIRDEGMDADFVAKKYCPIVSEDQNKEFFSELLRRFRDEARILFRLNHPNIVRVFNYYDYSEYKTAYILMEHISGSEFLDYLRKNPSSANRVFEGVVRGFAHLQSRDVLHRDIRPANILVDDSGEAKIIDFGFGKQVVLGKESDEQKSISLNWWCETPPELSQGTYDFQTEVYFIGKLFHKAMEESRLSTFKYTHLVQEMCEPERSKRVSSFEDVQRKISEGQFAELSFTNDEVTTYRKFATTLFEVVSSIQVDAKFENDPTKILLKLEELHRKTQLEHTLAAQNKLVSIFVNGAFRYWNKAEVHVETLSEFINFLKKQPESKKAIVVENLLLRLEATERTSPPNDFDDEIPF